MKSHRILAFEKVRAPSSTLLNERIRVALGDAGYLQVAVPEVPTPAGATLAAVIVEEAAGQLARQDLLARLMERAQCKERAANKYLGQAIQAGRLAKVRDGAQVLYQSMPEVMA
jgi:hypothetical protein